MTMCLSPLILLTKTIGITSFKKLDSWCFPRSQGRQKVETFVSAFSALKKSISTTPFPQKASFSFPFDSLFLECTPTTQSFLFKLDQKQGALQGRQDSRLIPEFSPCVTNSNGTSTSQEMFLMCSPQTVDSDRDMVHTAVTAGNFKSLTTSLRETGFIKTLKGKVPFTTPK